MKILSCHCLVHFTVHKLVWHKFSHCDAMLNDNVVMGQIQQQGWKLISIWKSPSFTPDRPRLALFICIIIFIHYHSPYSWHLIRKSRYQSLKNIFFWHSYVEFILYFPCLLDVTRRFFRAPVIPRAHIFFFLGLTIIVHSLFMGA